MAVRQQDGRALREHLEPLAKRGHAEAIATLTPPEFPDELDYLYGWLYQLSGRSGVSMNGIVPLTYSTIESWARLTGHQPTSADVDALLVLDAVLCHPDAGEDA